MTCVDGFGCAVFHRPQPSVYPSHPSRILYPVVAAGK